MPLKGRVVALTGASGGLGRDVAQVLAERGAELLVIGRHRGDIPGVRFLNADLADEGETLAACEALAGEPIDVLVNLAGIQHFGPLEAEAPEHLRATFLVDLVAPVMLARAVLPGMKQRKSGQIVNLGSIFGSINYAHFASYSSAKAGLRGFSEALRRELKDTPIAVTYIAPRAVATGLSRGNVLAFAKLSGMSLDDPRKTAMRIVDAIISRRKDVYLGMPENIFVRLNALLPRVVDAALARNDRKARGLFVSPAPKDLHP
ncbi:MAG: SDR family oxidoreductase [Alphaproteobacteria bacterium]|nr:SDR family oxidoreductase [Alphaproteobacteria bacterium]